MMPNSLRLRLLIAGVVSILLALAIAAFGLTAIFERHVERRIDAELTVYLNQLVAGLEPSTSGELSVPDPPNDPRFEAPLSGLYWQIRREPGGPTLRSRSLWDSELDLPRQGEAEATIHHHNVTGPEGEKLYLLQRRVTLPTRLGGGTAAAAVAVDTAEVDAAVREFAGALIPLLAVTAALLLAASWLQVGIGLKPLSAVRRELAAIKSGERKRLGDGFPPEIQPLAQEVDSLLDAREEELARAKTRAADLAHGLRTPLQVLNSEVERLVKGGHAEVALQLGTVTKSMQQTVEREIAKARLASRSRKAAQCDIATVVAQVVRVIERSPDGERLEWTVSVPEDIIAQIDRDDMAEVLGNLIENASRHARTGVAISASIDHGTVVVVIRDDGAGIPDALKSEALRRGGRLDERGSGAGLGLAIANETVSVWGGTLDLENEEPGLAAVVRLPAH